VLVALAVIWAWLGPAVDRARAQELADDVFSAVLRLTSEIPPEARTANALGTRREGSGIAIDDNGLVLTIGYLMLEAMSVTVYDASSKPVPADILAYDHESGFGLVRAQQPLGVKPLRLGASASLEERDRALVINHHGARRAQGVFVVSRRVFAGYWEYLIDRAIFTSPPMADWSGAALVGVDGRLLGIGSLIVPDAYTGEYNLPGNMFVPIDLLKPIMADLLGQGRRAGPRKPWLGMFSTTVPGGALVTQIAPDGPAARAGIQPGDVVTGVGGNAVADLPDLYRKLWGSGKAGAEIDVTVRRGTVTRDLTVKSGKREDYLRLRPSY
jgi:S1-C subfamily serine protease